MNVQGFNPRTGAAVGEAIAFTTDAEVDARCARATVASQAWAKVPMTDRAVVLEKIADAIDAESTELAQIGDSETALGLPRLSGEIKRTTNQLRLFAEALREGSYIEATLDSANPDIIPPRPELRRMLQPLGPVAVFSASNFPFAFSVAGGDTASALAAGCAVVVKAHSAHPQTSRATAQVVARALADAGAPGGLFDIVYGTPAGARLVQHPAIKAVGFTGSTSGGRALFDLANARPDPIPFYGELGSVNPSVVLPGAATERADALATGFASSLTLGVGQFCTNPGLLFAPSSLVDALADAVSKTAGAPMLTQRMQQTYQTGTESLAAGALAKRVASGQKPDTGWSVAPQLFVVDLKTFAANLETLTEEHFGPAGIVVTYDDVNALNEVIAHLPGTLTGTVHAAASENDNAATVAGALSKIAGRVIYNAWPTGVAVAWGMHHGGPWPSTTNPLHTSVGATSVRRWLAPVSYQSWPDALLPPALQDANPLKIPRRRDGVLGAA